MILSDREIKAALARGVVRITPDPTSDPIVWSSTAVDLHLDRKLSLWISSSGESEAAIRPAHPDYNFGELLRKHTRNEEITSNGYALRPGPFALVGRLRKCNCPIVRASPHESKARAAC